MKKFFIYPLLALCLMLTSCANETNPLLVEWDTPYGIPPFENVKPEHYMPAYLKAMEVHNAEIKAIIDNPDAPNFENTILAYENAGRLLSNVSTVFGTVSGVASNETIMSIASELSPLTSKHYSEISLNEDLFKRVKAVYEKRNDMNLTPSQMKLVENRFEAFENSGANLPEEKKAALKELSLKLSALQLKFGQNLLRETAAFELVIDNEADLSGLTPGQIAEAASRAKAKGMEGKWIFGLDNPSVMPFLQYADNAELRKQILDAYLARCNNDNAEDNKEIIKELVKYRLERAQIFGYDNAAALILKDRMAMNEEAVYGLLDEVWKPALEQSKRELADMTKIARAEGVTSPLVASDWRYYFEKAKSEKFNISEEELRPYFELNKVRDGIFELCEKLWGITFTQIYDTPLPHAEATVYECKDADGSHLGLLFMDMLARPGEKRGGAWCGSYRGQRFEDGKRIAPLVTIVGNFTRPAGDVPALLSPDEVSTFFHEFGHALHSLFRQVEYAGIGGVPRDFVELPSQIMEHWAFEPELLKEYAFHYETGEVIPTELVEKLGQSGKYGQGFVTTEFVAASYLDMDYHVLTEYPENLDVEAFEKKVLDERGLISQIPPRYRSTYFSHTMGGGYTAGYYSYLWSALLDADAYQAFVETGDIFNKEVAKKFRDEVLSRGGEDEAMKMYVNFRGSEPGIEPLLKVRGLDK